LSRVLRGISPNTPFKNPTYALAASGGQPGAYVGTRILNKMLGYEMTPDNTKRTIIAQSVPAKGEAGRTGDWRSQTPEIDHEKCSQKDTCLLCWLYCPDGLITRDFPLEIDIEYCKGCGICAEECPRKAIRMKEGKE
jgi:pyruvate ferredoxin oxidoreductase delta subunit